MADNEKYYYLRLKEDFFDDDAIQILESMPDGYLYSNILLKLYLKSLKFNGKLMFNERIPYNATVLGTITRHSVGTVEKALSIFKDIGLIEILDNGAMYMLDIQNFIGKTSTEADRKRSYRERIEKEKLELSGQMSGQISDKKAPEIEIEKEIDKEIEIDIDKNNKHVCAFEELWNIYPRKKEKAKANKCFNARLKEGYSEKDMLLATKNYAAECKKNHTDERYIKLCATFLGPSTPFTDYIKKGDTNGSVRDNIGTNENQIDDYDFLKYIPD